MKLTKHKVVFITGAASGIGLAIGKKFLQDGDKVVFTDVNIEALNDTVTELREDGFDCQGFYCDVTNEEDLQRAINQTIDLYGALHVVVNNAGMQHVSTIENFDTEIFEKMIKMMLTASFISIKHAFPMMKHQQFGRVINVASINGLVGFAGKAAYNSAKHGVIGLTKVAALEGATDGITVNAICPSYVDTPLVRNQLKDLAENRGVSVDDVLEEVIYPLVPQRRLLEVDEVADYVLFLASDKAKSVTGQAVVMDGGYTAQ